MDRIEKYCPERMKHLILISYRYHWILVEKCAKIQTKLEVEFNSEGLYQNQGGCYWPAMRSWKWKNGLEYVTLTQKLSNFSF